MLQTTKPIKQIGEESRIRRSAIENAWIKIRKGPNASVGKTYVPANSAFIANGNFSKYLTES